MLKRIALIVVAVALLLSAGLAGVWFRDQGTGPAVAQTTESEYSPAQTITVVGQGSVRSEPDIAQVSIGLETSGETIAEAVAENGTKMTAMLQALEAAGIDEKDIQTTHYSVQINRYPEPMPRVAGSEAGEPAPQYLVSNMVNVTIRDLNSVGDVLDTVIEAGANNIWGVSFNVEDPSDAQAEAQAEATADARARAESLAALNGVELGPVMSVSEVVGGGGVPVALMAVERAAGGAGPISPGEVEVNYQVQVTYFIER
jgi:uncharacterized protein YggE